MPQINHCRLFLNQATTGNYLELSIRVLFLIYRCHIIVLMLGVVEEMVWQALSLFFILFSVYGCSICMCICAPRGCLVLKKFRRRHHIPGNWSHRWCELPYRCQDLHPDPLEEKPVFLRAEPPPAPVSVKNCEYIRILSHREDFPSYHHLNSCLSCALIGFCNRGLQQGHC